MKQKNKKLEAIARVGSAAFAFLTWNFIFGEVPEGYGNYRSQHRSDGKLKQDLGSPCCARLRSIKQLSEYGEICFPYTVDGKYYTGHRQNAGIGEWLGSVFLPEYCNTLK